jgi:hypothetical protein
LDSTLHQELSPHSSVQQHELSEEGSSGPRTTSKSKKPAVLWVLGIIAFLAIAAAFATSQRGSQDSSNAGTGDPSSSANATPNAAKTDGSNPEALQSSESVEAGIPGGSYKVGVDMQPGEYVIIGSGYMEITKDSTGSFDSIIANDNYSNRTIVVVKKGQYFNFEGTAYTWAQAPKVDLTSGVLEEGKYKVGVDFPAGEYKVISDGGGYVEVGSDASGTLSSIISNDNFTGSKYLTVKKGQYLTITRATLKLK